MKLEEQLDAAFATYEQAKRTMAGAQAALWDSGAARDEALVRERFSATEVEQRKANRKEISAVERDAHIEVDVLENTQLERANFERARIDAEHADAALSIARERLKLVHAKVALAVAGIDR